MKNEYKHGIICKHCGQRFLYASGKEGWITVLVLDPGSLTCTFPQRHMTDQEFKDVLEPE